MRRGQRRDADELVVGGLCSSKVGGVRVVHDDRSAGSGAVLCCTGLVLSLCDVQCASSRGDALPAIVCLEQGDGEEEREMNEGRPSCGTNVVVFWGWEGAARRRRPD